MPLEVGHLQFAFLFLSVPIQYFIVQQSGSSESHRTHQISVFIKQIKDFYQRWFRVESWVKWLRDLLDGKLTTVSKMENCSVILSPWPNLISHRIWKTEWKRLQKWKKELFEKFFVKSIDMAVQWQMWKRRESFTKWENNSWKQFTFLLKQSLPRKFSVKKLISRIFVL